MESLIPDFRQLLLTLPPILFALTVHEFAHAWAANRLGDPTARMMGRLTMNPLAHLDPLGTLMIIIAHFGWGKPVPVDVRYLKRPKQDMLWIALAGPASNVISAAIFGLTFRYLPDSAFLQWGEAVAMLHYAVIINLVLAFFNLIPLPPLDGSKVLAGLLPIRQEMAYRNAEHTLSIVLIVLIIIGSISHISLIGRVIMPPVALLARAFMGM
ncbi:MAG: site-2 protease family protein [Candidatus Latescibacteria bacterium]|nr:site-2 protease family protein [Candidatus Latescibacterota bacterium]